MKKFLVSIAVAALAAPMFAQTTPARVAVIDVNKVLTQSTAGKAAYEKLKKMQDDRMERAKSMDEELKKLNSDIETKRLSLSEDKLAGILILAEHLLVEVGVEDLPAFRALLSDRHLGDWSSCDWFCVKVLGPMLVRSPERERIAERLWIVDEQRVRIRE